MTLLFSIFQYYAPTIPAFSFSECFKTRISLLNAAAFLLKAFPLCSLEIYSTIFKSLYILNLLREYSFICLMLTRIWLHLQDDACTAALSAIGRDGIFLNLVATSRTHCFHLCAKSIFSSPSAFISSHFSPSSLPHPQYIGLYTSATQNCVYRLPTFCNWFTRKQLQNQKANI